MKTIRQASLQRSDSGTVLIMALLLLLALGGLAATLSTLNLTLHGEHQRAREDLRAFTVAEGGLNEGYAALLHGSVEQLQAMQYPRSAGDGNYRVEVIDGRTDYQIDLDRIRLRCVGEAGEDPAGVQLMVLHDPTGKYEFAAFGSQQVIMRSNSMVDSFNPDYGPYDDSSEFVNDFGNVGSFGEVELHSNVNVYGDALVGPDGTFDDNASGITVTGDQESKEFEVDMPAIIVQSYPSLGALTVAAAATWLPGNRHYANLTIRGPLTVKGPATLVVDAFTLRAGGSLTIDGSAGPVTLIGTGNFELRSNTWIRTLSGHAGDLEIQLTGNNINGGTLINIASNVEVTGTIYAPNAKIELSSESTIYGAVKAKIVQLDSNSAIHFDENLAYDDNFADDFSRVSWRRLSREEIEAVEVAVP
jgi:hypothetical protein